MVSMGYPVLTAVSRKRFVGAVSGVEDAAARDAATQGICISAGSACHRGKLSHVYAAMKLDKKTAAGVLRVSFAPETTEADVDALVSALRRHRETRFPML